MRRIALAGLAIGVVLLVQSAIAEPAARSCGRPQGHTLSQSDSARAYTLNGEVYACAIPGGAVYHLGSASVCVGTQRAAPVALADRLVAYGLETCGIDTGSTDVVVRRLTNGRRLHTDPAITGPTGAESYATVGSLVVKRNGSDAWITVTNSLGTHHSTTEVHAHDTTGFRLLDSGSAVDPASLRLRGSKLSWRHGGHKRSVTLR